MNSVLEHAEALLAAAGALLTSATIFLWRLEAFRKSFQNGVVRPVAAEEAQKAITAHVAAKHA